MINVKTPQKQLMKLIFQLVKIFFYLNNLSFSSFFFKNNF